MALRSLWNAVLKPVLKGCAGRLDEGWAIVVTAFWGALWLGGFYVDA
jgi:hypothetical protein